MSPCPILRIVLRYLMLLRFFILLHQYKTSPRWRTSPILYRHFILSSMHRLAFWIDWLLSPSKFTSWPSLIGTRNGSSSYIPGFMLSDMIVLNTSDSIGHLTSCLSPINSPSVSSSSVMFGFSTSRCIHEQYASLRLLVDISVCSSYELSLQQH